MNRNFWIVVGGLTLGLVLATVGGWRFVVHPLEIDFADGLAEKQDLSQKLQTARATAAQFGKFKAQAENMHRDLDFYSSRTDGSLSQLDVTQIITELGNQMGLRDLTVKVTELPAAGATVDMNKYDVVVDFHSDFEHVGKFINTCVNQRRIMVPGSVTLNALDDPNGLYFDTVSAEVDLTVYGGLKVKTGGRS